jgi:hypothetical protein
VPTCYYVQEQFATAFFGHKEFCLGYGVLPHIQLCYLNIQQKPLLALVHAHRANAPITSLGQCPQGILSTRAVYHSLLEKQGIKSGLLFVTWYTVKPSSKSTEAFSSTLCMHICPIHPKWAWYSTHMLLCTRAVPHSLLWTQGICLGFCCFTSYTVTPS